MATGAKTKDIGLDSYVRIIERCAKQLEIAGSKLILAGMNDRIMKQLKRTELMDLLGKEDIFPAEPQYFAPPNITLAKARTWIAVRDAGGEQ